MISRTWLRAVAVVSLVGLTTVTVTGAQQTPATERQRQDILAAFEAAREVFNTARQADSIPQFERVIALIEGTDYRPDRELRLFYARSLAYRSHALLNAGRVDDARRELQRLVRVDASFALDAQESPRPLLSMYEEVKKELVGTIVFSLPLDTIGLSVDGVVVDPTTKDYPIASGTYNVQIVTGSGVRSMESVIVSAGQRTTVVPRSAAATTTRTPIPTTTTTRRQGQASSAPPLPWRRIFVSGSALMFLYGPPQDRGFSQVIYNRNASFNLTETPQLHFGNFEFGIAGRLYKALGVGFAYTKTERQLSGSLSGSVPSPTSGFLRSFGPVTADHTEIERSYHIEVRGQFGGDDGEFAAYIGPSFVQVDAQPIRTFRVTELTGGSFIVAPTRTTSSEQEVGLNLGFDAAWFPSTVVGLGGGIRYVVSKNQENPNNVSESRQTTLATFGVRLRF